MRKNAPEVVTVSLCNRAEGAPHASAPQESGTEQQGWTIRGRRRRSGASEYSGSAKHPRVTVLRA
jgi:hypothetical protein